LMVTHWENEKYLQYLMFFFYIQELRLNFSHFFKI